jgi:hypothetical protein
MEELSVTGEELRSQTGELATTRQPLEAERQRYQELFEAAPVAYLVTDPTGRIRVGKGFLAGRPLAPTSTAATATGSARWQPAGPGRPGPGGRLAVADPAARRRGAHRRRHGGADPRPRRRAGVPALAAAPAGAGGGDRPGPPGRAGRGPGRRPPPPPSPSCGPRSTRSGGRACTPACWCRSVPGPGPTSSSWPPRPSAAAGCRPSSSCGSSPAAPAGRWPRSRPASCAAWEPALPGLG